MFSLKGKELFIIPLQISHKNMPIQEQTQKKPRKANQLAN